MRNVYLILAIAGALVPYYFFGQFILAEGMNLPGFLTSLVATAPASGFTSDLLITSGVFWVMMVADRRSGLRTRAHPLVFVAINLLVGLSCALPAYLYARDLELSRPASR